MKRILLQLLKPIIALPWLPVWLAPLILFSPLLLTGRPMFWGAVFLQFTPWRVAAFDQILAGHLPLWNSLNGMGAPLAANYQSALFYPPTWLLLPFYKLGGAGGLAMGETWSVVLHLIWAGIGMVLLLRKLGCGKFPQTIGALAFSLSGYLVTRAGFLSINATVAWMPWVILAAEHMGGSQKPALRSITCSGLVIGMLLLAGHAQTAFYTLLLTGCWLLFRQSNLGWKPTARAALSWGLSVLLGCGLAAIQLVPTVEYLLQSQRASEVGYEYAVNYSFLPWRFLTLLLPNLFGTPADGSYLLKADAYWEDAIYIGLLPACLAVAALVMAFVKKKANATPSRRGLTIFLAILALIASLIALGKYTSLFPFLYKYIPTFDLFQAPARWMIWLVFALSLMAGFGADEWRKPGKRGRFWLNLSLALGVTVTFIAVQVGFLAPEIPAVFIKAFIIFGASITLGCILAKTNPLPLKEKGKPVTIWQWAVILFVSADLLLANWGFHQGADPSLYEKATAVARAMKAQAGNGRIYISIEDLQQLQYEEFFNFRDFRLDGKWDALANALLPNTNLYGGLASLNNFDPLVPGRYNELITRLDKTDTNMMKRLLQRMGVSLDEYSLGGLANIQFKPLDGATRVRWVNCAFGAVDEEEVLEILFDRVARTETSQPVILENPGLATGNCSNTLYKTTIIEEKPDELVIQVNAPQEGWLVLSDTWYPGWRAWVDNQMIDINQANFLFRAMKVPAGQHTIRMAYQPSSFWLGFGLSLFVMVLLLVLFFADRRGLR